MANQNDRKCNDYPGNPEQQNEAHIMPVTPVVPEHSPRRPAAFLAALKDGRPSLYRRNAHCMRPY
jgi:hypothetical protein